MLLNTPSRREYDKVCDSYSRCVTWTREDREDGWILTNKCNIIKFGNALNVLTQHFTHTVVETDSIDCHEVGQVILVGVVVAMPSYNVKW